MGYASYPRFLQHPMQNNKQHMLLVVPPDLRVQGGQPF